MSVSLYYVTQNHGSLHNTKSTCIKLGQKNKLRNCALLPNNGTFNVPRFKAFLHVTFYFKDPMTMIISVKFPPFKIILTFMIKSTDFQRYLKWGFHCTIRIIKRTAGGHYVRVLCCNLVTTASPVTI